MIIDTSYLLIAPLNIPQANPDIPNNSGRNYSNKSRVQAFIDRYESELLINALGREQYAELLSQLNEDGTFITDPIQKWVDLVDGKDNWNGLRYAYGDYKISLIAYYVYYHYLRDTETFYAVTGLVKPEVANATIKSANIDLVTQWNKFLTMYGGYGCTNNYWDLIWIDYHYNSGVENSQSLYEYLSAYPDDYSVEYFNGYGFKNRHGL